MLSFLLIIFLIALIIAYSVLNKPRGYSIDLQNIIILRKGKNINIEISQISEIKYIEHFKTTSLIRLWLISINPFAEMLTFGSFWSFQYGKIHVYITTLGSALLIKTNNRRKYVISPDDSEITLIMQYCPVKILNYQ